MYDGNPGVETCANSPQALIPGTFIHRLVLFMKFNLHFLSGMNNFLKQLNITFRRDPTNYRPRINKMESIKDKEQKYSGNYFFIDDIE